MADTDIVIVKWVPEQSRYMSVEDVGSAIQGILAERPDLLRDEFTDDRGHPLEGHCYVATESLYVSLGGTQSPYTPCQLRHEGVSHWFLRNDRTDEVIDLTAAQFESTVPYEQGRGRGFQKCPSDRAQEVLDELVNQGFDVEY